MEPRPIRYTRRMTLLSLVVMLLPSALAQAEVPPPNRLVDWAAALEADTPGTRVGMIAEASGAAPLAIDVWDGVRWVRAREVFREADARVLIADLGQPTTSARLRSKDADRVRSLDWDLFTPVPEPRSDRRVVSRSVLPTELVAAGVVSRAEWGAAATECTSTEDDWYRMAIHHTAGGQTYGGTVEGTVRVLQSYSMSGGEYCDIPYQYLVGYDGTLYEGRPYGYTSGATGGGNNDGNVAVCFLGCYDSGGCSSPDAVTEEMMDHGQELVQTLVALHDIPSDTDSIRGHRDWPGNATACPGDWLYARLDELRADLLPTWAGTFSSQTFPLAYEGAVTLVEGETATGSITLVNSGSGSWTPGVTFLAPTPRDVASPFADASWVSTTRAATVGASTATGGAGSFSFALHAPDAPGEYTLTFGLVQEGVAWFADDGGPADDLLQVRVVVTAAPIEDTDTPVEDTDTDGSVDDPDRPATDGANALSPGERVALSALGCGCAATPPAPWLVGLGVALLVARRRR